MNEERYKELHPDLLPVVDDRKKKSGLLKVSLTANFLLEETKDRYAEKWYHKVGEN